ncbi:uncharacterized protein LOC127102839 [Lathyrus oleraceus]|uniref:uncharacterized protein LOC127102839 n=1 Tax=Pisum sativum TaxID=3888 RepID=UPI0021D0FE90|nr:uncharacterized protein LOC127102839 [Pisum sativum]
MTLEQLEANQVSMRTDIDSMQAKMDRLLETMLLLAQKEKDAETNAEARKVAAEFGSPSLSIPGVTELDGNPAQPRGGPIPIPVPMVNMNPREHSATSARHGSVIGDEDPYDAFFMPQPAKPAVGGLPDPAVERLHALEEKFKSLEVHTTPGLDAVDMCLVPGLVIPQKFKVPDFDKYKGISCPRTHLRAYCRKMAAHIKRGQVQSWRDLAEAFLRHYQYNTDLAPNRTQLQDMTQRNNESFKEYAQRWRELAARVQPPLLDKELIDMFMGAMHTQYMEKMVGSSFPTFAEVVSVGERIESQIKKGKLPCAANASCGVKKPYPNLPKKPEGQTNAIMRGGGYRAPPYAPTPYDQVAAVIPTPYQPPYQQPHQRQYQQPYQQPAYQQPHQNQQQRAPQPRQPNQQRARRPERHFDPLPVSYSKILPYLLKDGSLSSTRFAGNNREIASSPPSNHSLHAATSPVFSFQYHNSIQRYRDAITLVPAKLISLVLEIDYMDCYVNTFLIVNL